jgi:hypothetical protein
MHMYSWKMHLEFCLHICLPQYPTETAFVPRRLACRLRATTDGIKSGEIISGYVAVSAADVDVGVNVR